MSARGMVLNQAANTHGLCECGCGGATRISPVTHLGRGLVRGQPLRFIHGHNRTRLNITGADYRIESRGFVTSCWVWSHYTSPQGYGKVGIRGKVRLAHIVMYEQEIGPVPRGSELDHLCRVSACIRPDHLEPVGHRENVMRGRARKLTYEQILAIRADGRSSYAVARDFGISHSYAWELQTGRRRSTD